MLLPGYPFFTTFVDSHFERACTKIHRMLAKLKLGFPKHRSRTLACHQKTHTPTFFSKRILGNFIKTLSFRKIFSRHVRRTNAI